MKTRMPRRRILAVAALGAVAAAGLTGCARAEPNAAAYVADKTFTNQQVEKIVDGVKDKAESGKLGNVRQNVVTWLVLGDVSKRLAAEQHIPVKVDYASGAQQLGLPADLPYTRLEIEAVSYISAVTQNAPQVQPTDAQLRAIYDKGRAAGVIPASVTFEQAKPRLDGTELRGALGQQKVLTDALAKYHATVNPRYLPAEYPLLSFQGGNNGATPTVAVGVPLGPTDATPAVTDQSAS